MIDFLLGIPGKLKTISDYLTTNWTTTRAAKVDNLDAAITTRAPASTALSTATWTSGLASTITAINTKADTLLAIPAGANTVKVTIAVSRHSSTESTTTHYTCPSGKTAFVMGTLWTWSSGAQFYIGAYDSGYKSSSGSSDIVNKILTSSQTIRVKTTSYQTVSVSATLVIIEV